MVEHRSRRVDPGVLVVGGFLSAVVWFGFTVGHAVDSAFIPEAVPTRPPWAARATPVPPTREPFVPIKTRGPIPWPGCHTVMLAEWKTPIPCENNSYRSRASNPEAN